MRRFSALDRAFGLLFVLLFTLLFASPTSTIMLPVLGGLGPSGGPSACTEESCSGDCMFAVAWEDGTGVRNTGGSEGAFDSDTGTVSRDTSTWDTSCTGEMVTITGSPTSYLTSNNGGSYWNEGTIYVRLAFMVTSISASDGDYNYLVYAESSAAAQCFHLRIHYNATTKVDGKDQSVRFYVRHGESLQQVGTSHGIDLDTWYGVEAYYSDVDAAGSEDAGWKLWDASGSLLHPAAGFDEETNLDMYNADGSVDVIYIGSSRDQDNMTVRIDKVMFSGAAIGAPTR